VADASVEAGAEDAFEVAVVPHLFGATAFEAGPGDVAAEGEVFADGADVVEFVGDGDEEGFLVGLGEEVDGVAFAVFPTGEAVGFGGVGDEFGDAGSEESFDVGEAVVGVFDDVVEDGGGGDVFGDAGHQEHAGGIERMDDVGDFGAFAVLAGVGRGGEFDGAEDEGQFGGRHRGNHCWDIHQ